jgi:hypothetical protein
MCGAKLSAAVAMPRVMAIAIRNVIDGVPRHMAANPDLDMDACTREIVTMFSLATAREEA